MNIKPALSYLAPDHRRTSYESVKFKWVKNNRVGIKNQEKIPVVQYTTMSDDYGFLIPLVTPKTAMEIDENALKEEENCIQSYEKTFEPENIVIESVKHDDNFFDNFDDCDGDENVYENHVQPVVDKQVDVDGMNLEEEYATMVPISMKEAKAVVDVYKMFAHGKYQCEVCRKAYYNENRLTAHMRMHDMVNNKFNSYILVY